MNIDQINGNTRLMGLLGYPVGHTLSPVIHNELAREFNHNLIYVPFCVKPEDIGEAVKGAYALNVKGLNATVPHKQGVIPYLSDIDPLAGKIGAVNTLVRTDDGYKGYNTDILGLKRQLEEENIDIQGRDCILLGAGGAARAVAFLLAKEGAKSIYIFNRTKDKAESLAGEINKHYPGTFVTGAGNEEQKEILGDKKDMLCIQATSAGLYPDVDRAPVNEDDFYGHISDAVDIIYNPENTLFMKKASKAGARSFNGLRMLLYQGVIAYELWNDVKVGDISCNKIYDLMEDTIRERNNE